MPKTEVILTHNIVGLGGESDHVKVNAGYARNYLLPQGLAIPVTQGNKRRLESLRQRRAEREAHEYNTMNELSKSISKLIAVIHMKTGDDGKMFGSVTSGTIADALKTQFDITLDKKKIHLEHPIKALGEHEIELRLHPEVITSMKVRVETDKPAEVEAMAGAIPPVKDGGKVTEKRSRRPEARAEEAKPEAKAPAKAKRPEKK
jgi:large subunit ribosomal protein L9